MRKKIGVFGGSFDPIHLGHINLCIHLAEKAGLDEVLFCPAKISPFKVDKPPVASFEQRCTMVECALKEIGHFSLSSIDAIRPAPSFMIDTLEELKKEYKDADLFLMIASDTYVHFDRWKRAEDIIKIAPLIVGSRPGFEVELDSNQSFSKGRYYPVPSMDISSKNLRYRLEKKLYCGHQIPAKVLDFIYENRLYY